MGQIQGMAAHEKEEGFVYLNTLEHLSTSFFTISPSFFRAETHKSINQGGANRLFSTALDLQSHGQEKIGGGWSGLDLPIRFGFWPRSSALLRFDANKFISSPLGNFEGF
jgi:hypothetical protein